MERSRWWTEVGSAWRGRVAMVMVESNEDGLGREEHAFDGVDKGMVATIND